jgi:lysophospholipase L1-like esterase
MKTVTVKHSFLLTFSIFVLCSVFYFIPETNFYGIKIKNIYLISDIESDPIEQETKKIIPIVKEFVDTCPSGITCFEDYSKNKDALNKIFEALKEIHENKTKVRIGFFGDSFIEGDILTSEVRKNLQNRFGGGGVGFVPIASEVSGFRQTVIHKHVNFSSFNIINHSRAKIPFAAGGYCFYPLPGNILYYAGIGKSTRLKRFNNIRVFYETNQMLPVNFSANNQKSYFQTVPSNKIEAHNLKNIKTNSISFNFPASNSLKLYGISIEDSSGVVLDNFGMKSNSGINLNNITERKHREFDSLQNYKLIVLQYGLNAVGPTTTNLTWYINSMTRVVKRIKKYYPQASILLLSVSDRATRFNGKIQTMPTIPIMIEAQRKIAKNAGIAFWDMFSAIGGKNTIIKYVNNSPALANKDFTHLTFKGGEKVAEVFTKTFLHEYKKYYDKKNHNLRNANLQHSPKQ